MCDVRLNNGIAMGDFVSGSAVPEPASLAILGVGLVGLGRDAAPPSGLNVTRTVGKSYRAAPRGRPFHLRNVTIGSPAAILDVDLVDRPGVLPG